MISLGLNLWSTTILARGGADAYGIGGFSPALVFDFTEEYYRTGGFVSTFDSAMTATRAGNATMVDSDGLLKWAHHNLALNSATPATQSITVVSGADYTVECTGVSIALSGAGTGTVTEGNPVEITASTTTLTLTVTGSTGTMWAYRSDLGGMVANPDTGNSYVPTTSSARYLPRRGHHVYNGTEWVNEGLLVESEPRTQLLHTTNALVTQSYTVTAVPHTLHFTGTGTVTLSGASTAGPLVGTGTGEENRVSLTFTPTAASLTLTVSGTVTDAQLEAGSTPSSYIPNLAGSGTVTRAADVVTIAAADLPYPTPRVIGPELFFSSIAAQNTWTADAETGVITAGGTATVDRVVFNLNESIVAGRVYRIVISASISGGAYYFDLNSAANLNGNLPSGTITRIFVAAATSNQLRVGRWAGGTLGTIAVQSLEEIDPLAVSIQMDGRMDYSASTSFYAINLARWRVDGNNYIDLNVDTLLPTITGQFKARQNYAGTIDEVKSAGTYYSPGLGVPFNIASRHGSTFINVAASGTALTANTTPVALPDLSATNLNLAYDYMGCLKTFRMWNVDITDEGIAEASA